MLKATEEKNIFSDKNIEAYGYASKQRAGMIWSPFAKEIFPTIWKCYCFLWAL